MNLVDPGRDDVVQRSEVRIVKLDLTQTSPADHNTGVKRVKDKQRKE